MSKGHSAVGARHARVCEGEELDASAGIRNREKRVVEVLVSELKRTKPDS